MIRVDSSTEIGSGHVMRCITLGKQLQKSGDRVIFIMRDLPGNIIDVVKNNGFQVLIMPQAKCDISLDGYEQWLTVPVQQDAEEVLAAIKNYLQREADKTLQKNIGKIDRLVIDSYAIDYRWERILRSVTKEIFVIDDLANRKHSCDILLDQNFYLDKDTRYNGLVPDNCQLLLGPEHALLREEFYAAKKHLRHRDGKIKNILVFYGGIDLTDETTKAIKALIKVHKKYDFSVNVIVGKSNPKCKQVEELCAKYPYINYHCQVSNMAEYMNAADLMLGAGGTTTWERMFLQLPCLVTAIAENQLKICEDCAKAGIIDYLGRHSDATIEQIEKRLEKKFSSSESRRKL